MVGYGISNVASIFVREQQYQTLRVPTTLGFWRNKSCGFNFYNLDLILHLQGQLLQYLMSQCLCLSELQQVRDACIGNVNTTYTVSRSVCDMLLYKFQSLRLIDSQLLW